MSTSHTMETIFKATGIEKMQQSLAKITQGLKSNALNTALWTVALTALKDVGVAAFRKLWEGLKSGAQAVITTFSDFEQAAFQVWSIAGVGADELKTKLLELDPALGSLAVIADETANIMAQGYDDLGKSIEVATAAAMVSKSKNIEIGAVVDAIVPLLRNYGEELKTAADAANFLVTAEQQSAGGMQSMVENMLDITKVSSILGVSINELGGAYAVLSTSGSSASEAGTQLKNLFLKLSDASDKLKSVYRELGITSVETTIKQQGLEKTLRAVRDKADEMGIAYDDLFTRQRAYLGFVSLMKDDFAILADRTSKMTTEAKIASDIFNVWKETTKGLWETLKNQFGRILVEIGTNWAPKIKKAIKGLSDDLINNKDEIIKWGSDVGEGLNESYEAVKSFIGNNKEEIKALVSVAGTAVTAIAKLAIIAVDLNKAYEGVKVMLQDNLVYPYRIAFEDMANISKKALEAERTAILRQTTATTEKMKEALRKRHYDSAQYYKEELAKQYEYATQITETLKGRFLWEVDAEKTLAESRKDITKDANDFIRDSYLEMQQKIAETAIVIDNTGVDEAKTSVDELTQKLSDAKAFMNIVIDLGSSTEDIQKASDKVLELSTQLHGVNSQPWFGSVTEGANIAVSSMNQVKKELTELQKAKLAFNKQKFDIDIETAKTKLDILKKDLTDPGWDKKLSKSMTINIAQPDSAIADVSGLLGTIPDIIERAMDLDNHGFLRGADDAVKAMLEIPYETLKYLKLNNEDLSNKVYRSKNSKKDGLASIPLETVKFLLINIEKATGNITKIGLALDALVKFPYTIFIEANIELAEEAFEKIKNWIKALTKKAYIIKIDLNIEDAKNKVVELKDWIDSYIPDRIDKTLVIHTKTEGSPIRPASEGFKYYSELMDEMVKDRDFTMHMPGIERNKKKFDEMMMQSMIANDIGVSSRDMMIALDIGSLLTSDQIAMNRLINADVSSGQIKPTPDFSKTGYSKEQRAQALANTLKFNTTIKLDNFSGSQEEVSAAVEKINKAIIESIMNGTSGIPDALEKYGRTA